jgi:K+-sensing histidine kinase KdpD
VTTDLWTVLQRSTVSVHRVDSVQYTYNTRTKLTVLHSGDALLIVLNIVYPLCCQKNASSRSGTNCPLHTVNARISFIQYCTVVIHGDCEWRMHHINWSLRDVPLITIVSREWTGGWDTESRSQRSNTAILRILWDRFKSLLSSSVSWDVYVPLTTIHGRVESKFLDNSAQCSAVTLSNLTVQIGCLGSFCPVKIISRNSCWTIFAVRSLTKAA